MGKYLSLLAKASEHERNESNEESLAQGVPTADRPATDGTFPRLSRLLREGVQNSRDVRDDDRPGVARLSGPLERLVRAAAASDRAWGPAVIESGLVLELRDYVLAWAASHLLGESEAEARLWAAYAAWAKVARA